MAAKRGASTRPDMATILGIVLALGGIVGGLLLEKGSVKDIAQYTAAIIVFGGTMGAVLVNTPTRTLLSAVTSLKDVFFERAMHPVQIIDEILVFATKARKQGIVSLDQDAEAIADPFLQKAIRLAVDGSDLEELKGMMELEIELNEAHAEEAAKVFDSGGGYAPTIGIIGAVLGLIQVMKNLSNIEEVGHGIAVAFVATVYGVGLSNIFLLPAGAKIRGRAAMDRRLRELMLEGVVGIMEGSNPKMIRNKLSAYLLGEADNGAAKDSTPKAA
jgi:chemotaxis protein MotA